ncbi:hypothetical protein [Salinigranum sp.]|uniref:hypothetical protein n=1 Tax=Salinigranum sp. TaxID=1966351 RepID=UPI003561DCBE
MSPSTASSPPTSSAVEWEFSPATTRPLRLLVYVAVGLGVGPVCGLVVLVGATLVGGGGVGVALFVFVLALFVGFGVGSGRALFALGNAPPEVHETVRALSRGGVVASVLLGTGGGVVGLRWTDVGFELVVGGVVAGFVALVVGAGLQSEGVVDGDTGELTYAGHTVPLDAIRRVRTLRLGRFVVLVVDYHPGRVGASTPRVVVCSRAARDQISAGTRRETPASGADEQSGERAPRAVRAVAATFGLACLVVGPVLWILVPAEGRLIVGYLGVFGLLFGALFVRYAVVA